LVEQQQAEEVVAAIELLEQQQEAELHAEVSNPYMNELTVRLG
jgi:hypothetical protein